MSCTESNYASAGIIEAYPISEVQFPPLSVLGKYIKPNQVEISDDASPIVFRMSASSPASIQENPGNVGQAEYYTDTVTFRMENPSSADIERIEAIRHTPHHILCRSLGDNKMWLPVLDNGYHCKVSEVESTIEVSIVITNPCGALRQL